MQSGASNLFIFQCHQSVSPLHSSILKSIHRINWKWYSIFAGVDLSRKYQPQWRAAAHCESAPPYGQPSGRAEKNGGMQAEEHLVCSEFALTWNVMDGFPLSQAQIWTYTLCFFIGLWNGQLLWAPSRIICLLCLMIAHQTVSMMESDDEAESGLIMDADACLVTSQMFL